MAEKSFMTVEEVAAELRVSKSKAYGKTDISVQSNHRKDIGLVNLQTVNIPVGCIL